MIRIGTRRSPLAQAQADRVIARLSDARKVVLDGDGDHDPVTPLHQLGAPGAFTRTLTDAILDGRVDAAVHSLKDLPLAAPPDAPVVAILERDDPADILLIRSDAHDPSAPLALRSGARVGTSAPRRQAQLSHADPTIVPIDVRGNIQTRIRLLQTGTIDALVMASAVFQRITPRLPAEVIRHRLDPTLFPGSPGQGTIAVQVHRDHPQVAELRALDDSATRRAVEAERAVLAQFGGGCGLPLGVNVHADGTEWILHATYDTPHGFRRLSLRGHDTTELVGRAMQQLRNIAHPSDDAARSSPAAPPSGNSALHGDVIITIDSARLGSYQTALSPHGFAAHAWPVIDTPPTGTPLPDAAHTCGWIAVTSRRAAPFAAQAVHAIGRLPRIAAVGVTTASALRAHDLPVHLVAADGTVESLAEGIARFPRMTNTGPPPHVLRIAATRPAGSLDGHGLSVTHWPVYDTRATSPPPAAPLRRCHTLVVTSPSSARAYAANPAPPECRHLVAFGPRTARALHDQGTPATEVLHERSPEGLTALIVREVTA